MKKYSVYITVEGDSINTTIDGKDALDALKRATKARLKEYPDSSFGDKEARVLSCEIREIKQ